MVTLETTLLIVVLVPLLFAVIEFGVLFPDWLAPGPVGAPVDRGRHLLTDGAQRQGSFRAQHTRPRCGRGGRGGPRDGDVPLGPRPA